MQIKIILSLLALFSIIFFVPSDAFGAWYDTEWEYRNKITVSLDSVISNDLSDFQNNDVISNMSDTSIICHQCIIEIQNKVKDDLDSK